MFYNCFRRSLDIRENFACGNTQGVDSMAGCPLVPHSILLRLLGIVVDHPIDLDCEASVAAVEIQDIIAGFVLTAELEAVRSPAKQPPQQDFRQCHLLAKLSCSLDAAGLRLRRNVLEHGARSTSSPIARSR